MKASNQTLYDHTAEYSAVIQSPVDRVFDWLDDQTRLAQHMAQRSWKMGWGKMEIELDGRRGRALGAHIVLRGRVLGVDLSLDEVVTRYEPPLRKTWKTVGEPRLLVIGAYEMGFELVPLEATTRLRVTISYRLPTAGVALWLGRLFGKSYAAWCVRKMVEDAGNGLRIADPHQGAERLRPQE